MQQQKKAKPPWNIIIAVFSEYKKHAAKQFNIKTRYMVDYNGGRDIHICKSNPSQTSSTSTSTKSDPDFQLRPFC